MSRRDAHDPRGADDKRHHIGSHEQEPDATIGAGRDRGDIAVVRQGEPRHGTAGGDTCDGAGLGREPDVAVWPGADRSHSNVCLLGSPKERNRTRRGDPAHVSARVDEPDIAVWPRRERHKWRLIDRHSEFGEQPGRGDPADGLVTRSDPEVAVCPGDQATRGRNRPGKGSRDDLARCRHPRDLVGQLVCVACASRQAHPERAVWCSGQAGDVPYAWWHGHRSDDTALRADASQCGAGDEPQITIWAAGNPRQRDRGRRGGDGKLGDHALRGDARDFAGVRGRFITRNPFPKDERGPSWVNG